MPRQTSVWLGRVHKGETTVGGYIEHLVGQDEVADDRVVEVPRAGSRIRAGW